MNLSIFFPVIQCQEADKEISSVGFKSICVSVFDHWLNQDEAVDRIKPYKVLLHELGKTNQLNQGIVKKLDDYYSHEANLMKLYVLLFKSQEVFFYDKKKKDFSKFIDLESYMDLCQKSIREEKFQDIYIPNLECALIGNWDFTLPLYYRDKRKVDKIIQLIKICSLYVLE